MPPMKARKMDRCSQMAVAGTRLALQDAGIELQACDPARIGIALGSGFCGVSNSAEFLSGYFTGGVEGLLPMLFPNTVPNSPASNAAIEFGFTGPNITVVQRFCSAETALLMACRFIQEGRADIMLTGGVDELIPVLVKGLACLGQISASSIPFGEGCGMIVLERASHASQRRALPYGTLHEISTIGMLLPGSEQEGLDRLLGTARDYSRISLSGSVEHLPEVMARIDGIPQFHIGRLIGRSLAMGGTALATLLAGLDPGDQGLHLAVSPEGPCCAIRVGREAAV